MMDVHLLYLLVARDPDTYPMGIVHDPRKETVSFVFGEEFGVVDLLSMSRKVNPNYAG